jgi:hypothetical protein
MIAAVMGRNIGVNFVVLDQVSNNPLAMMINSASAALPGAVAGDFGKAGFDIG